MKKSKLKSILEKRRKKGKNDDEWGLIIPNLSGIIAILSSYIFEVRNPDAVIDPYFDEIRKILGACGLIIFYRAFSFRVSLDSYRLFSEVLHFNRRMLNVRLFRKISWITLDVIVVIMLYLLIAV